MSGENASSVPQVPPRNGRNMAAALMAEGTGTHFEEVTISAYEWRLYKALGIQQFIHDTIGAKFVVIDEIKNFAVFKCQSDVKPNLDSAIDQFKKSIGWKTVEFTEHTSVLLWFGSKPNAKLKHYFNSIKRFKGHIYADICLQESKPTCVVYGRDENILSKAVDAISSSLVHSRCSEAIIHPQRTILVKAQQEGLLQLLNTEKNFVSFVCTNAVLNSIQNNLCTEKIEIPSIVAKYFNFYAEQFIQDLAMRTGVNIEFPILQKTLEIRGVLNEINQFKSQLDTLFFEKHTTVQLTKEEKVLIAEYLHQVAGGHRCIADLSNCDIQENESTCRYLFSWFHVRSTGRLSVVEGNVQNMDVDLVIIPADHNNQPLSQTAAKVLPAWSKVQLINVQSSSRGFPLYTKLQSVAQPYVGRKIAVFVPDNDLDKSFFLAELVTMFQTLPATQIYIVTPALEVEEIIQIIDDNFRSVMTENSGFFHEKHVENILTKTGLHEVDIQVTKRSLLESEADALVITVGSDLDLARGNLCTQILNAAGQIIQEDLRTKQKERHSNVYVTHAGELGFRSPGHEVKCIIHCLLQQFNKDDFMSVLISFVETCLLEADMKMCTSVAFPALGTGNLGYPVRDVAVAMFEAVRTYRKKVINPSVKKVIFCVGKPENEGMFSKEKGRYEDRTISTVYESIESRLKGIPSIQKIVNSIQMAVVNKQDFGVPPANAKVVAVHFNSNEKVVHGQPFQPSQKNKWMDEIDFFAGPHTFEETWKTVFQIVKEENVTNLTINTYFGVDSQMTYKQIQLIEEETKKLNSLSVKNVVIVVEGREVMAELGDRLLAKTFVYFKSVLGLSWITTALEIGFFEMRCVGLSKDKVNEAFMAMERTIKARKESVALPNAAKQSSNDERLPYDTNVDDVSAEQHISTQIKEQNHAEHEHRVKDNIVTATINPGILNYLEKMKTKEKWLKDVKKVFQLQILPGNVCGKLESIISFEHYLETSFPSCPERSFEWEIINAQDCEASVHSVTFGKTKILVVDGDIMSVNADVIICPNNAMLSNPGGVAESIFKAAGEEYVKELREVSQLKLDITDCRVVGSGNLNFKKVIHTFPPNFVSLKNKAPLVSKLQMTIFNCFETATRMGFTTMVMPLLCTGKGGLPYKESTLALVQALKWMHFFDISLPKIIVVVNDHSQQQDVIEPLRILECGEDEYKTCVPKLISSTGMRLKSDLVIRIVKGQLHMNESVDAIVIQEDEMVSGKGDTASNVLLLANDTYVRERNALTRDMTLGQAKRQNITGGQLRAKFVVHVVVPVWTGTENLDEYEKRIVASTLNAFETSSKSCKSLGIDTIGKVFGRHQSYPVFRCCSAMMKGMRSHFKKKTDLKTIDLVMENDFEVEMMYELLKHEEM